MAAVAPLTLADLVKHEYDANYTREIVTIKGGVSYPLGAVLGRITATGVYALSPATSTAGLEGAEIACAVLLEAVPESPTDVQALALVRGPAIVADAALRYDDSVIDAAKRSVKKDQLTAHGIVVRVAV